ncbi:hypothetical protein HMPREF1624_07632 [Sporothrix schenckii ATCC 58251]|uniref:C2H2-type domain-containing protein n=1 Tax=Sporothrix schenckii (strain ATCC 58251 / de Perez 2211183) TaxID=1391915 RepID=U7PME2_SPOS1|nr:hypothetical protein HMPREF1624_07632 [Sporothrix schenckii ATCC 58251]
MTMAVDSSQQRYLNNFDHMNSYSHHTAAAPHFTNPWTAPSGASQQNAYSSMQQHPSLGGIDSLRQHHQQQQPQPHQQLPQPHSQQPQQPHHHQLPQPSPHHHQAPHHAQHSPVTQQHPQQQSPSHHQQPHPHHQQQQQQQHQHSHQQAQAQRTPQAQQQSLQGPPRPPSQQPLPPAPSLHRNGSTSMPPSAPMAYGTAGGMAVSLPQAGALGGATTTSAGYADSSNLAASYSAPSPIHPTAAYAAAATPYDQMGYAPATTMRGAAPPPPGGAFGLDASAAEVARRFSQDAAAAAAAAAAAGAHPGDNRRGFQDALEASQGMMSLNSQDTPRPMGYPGATAGGGGGGSAGSNGLARSARGSADSYGFPSTAHSTSSSVSSQSFGGFYTTGGSSIDSNSNISDYSGSDMEGVSSRRHHHMLHGGVPPPPAPHHHGVHGAAAAAHPGQRHQPPFVGSVPPAPQSMMGQFSSKMTNSAQKKHKCKVCDKRFTRPSSLQTHMYSHTGEKPFRCEVPGCGRNFSVVSNLRRHRKVHKDLTPSEAGSDDHHNSE